MSAVRFLLGMWFCLASGLVVCAQNAFTGAAAITLQFKPANPSMADSQLEVRAFADLSSVTASGGDNPILTGFSIPVGFDSSRVLLLSVSSGQAPGYSDAGFAYTDVAVANARGFVTLMNTRSGTENPGMQVELARLVFQLTRPGSASFLAGSARTIHPGALIGVPTTAGAPTQRIPWVDHSYSLSIGSSTTVPSLFCPSWFSMPGTFQGVAFLNEGKETATIQVFGWDRHGALAQLSSAVNPSPPVVLAPMRQEAKVTEEIFNSPAAMGVEHGWIEVRSSQPDISGFFLQGMTSATGVEAMDGADMVYAPASWIVFPMVGSDSGRATEICLVNPASSPVSANIRLMNSDGSTAQTFQTVVAAHGTAVQEISQTSGYVEVNAADGQLLGFERFGTGKALAALNGQDGSMVPNRLSGPQFASGYLGSNLRINTQIALVNPSSQTSRVILRLLNEQGQEMAAPVVRSMAAKSQLSSPGWELFGLANPLTTSQVFVGTLSVASDQGVIGAMTFGDPVAGTYLAALPLMSTSAAKREIFFGHVAVGRIGDVDYFTGLALVNTSTIATANIQLELYDKEGKLVAGTQTPYALGPNSRTAQLVQQLIPEFKGSQSGGFIRLVSDVEVYAYMLFGDTSYNFLSAVPIR